MTGGGILNGPTDSPTGSERDQLTIRSAIRLLGTGKYLDFRRKVVSQHFASWNLIGEFLEQLNRLSRALDPDQAGIGFLLTVESTAGMLASRQSRGAAYGSRRAATAVQPLPARLEPPTCDDG